MNAPFVEHNETKGADVLFHPSYQVGRTIVETDDRTRDNIQYETVKKLLSAGRRVEAKYVLRALLNCNIVTSLAPNCDIWHSLNWRRMRD